MLVPALVLMSHEPSIWAATASSEFPQPALPARLLGVLSRHMEWFTDEQIIQVRSHRPSSRRQATPVFSRGRNGTAARVCVVPSPPAEVHLHSRRLAGVPGARLPHARSAVQTVDPGGARHSGHGFAAIACACVPQVLQSTGRIAAHYDDLELKELQRRQQESQQQQQQQAPQQQQPQAPDVGSAAGGSAPAAGAARAALPGGGVPQAARRQGAWRAGAPAVGVPGEDEDSVPASAAVQVWVGPP